MSLSEAALFLRDNPPPDPAQPNVVLIVIDDNAFDQYGFMGHPTLLTPNIDALAAASVRYVNGYVPPFCRPSLATLLTGLREEQHGVTYTFGTPLADQTSIADRLSAAGYECHQAGKIWEGSPSGKWGFDSHDPYSQGSLIGNLDLGRVSIQGPLDFMAGATEPWFLWCTFPMPHSPHDAPQQYVDLYDGLGLTSPTQQYYAMVSWTDDVIGNLLAAVPSDAVVIFMADNGYVQDPDVPEFATPDSKDTSFDRGHRTPVLLRHPSRHPETRTDLVHGVDVPATVCAMAGASRAGLIGRDLARPARWGGQVIDARWGPNESDSLTERWIRWGPWKLVEPVAGSPILRHLPSDPTEQADLGAQAGYELVVAALQARLEELWLA